MPLTTNIIFDGFTRLWRLRRYLFEKSSITPIYPSSRLCTCKLPTPSKCKLLLWVCSNLLLILLCCVAKLAQNWFMKENTKQLALYFCLSLIIQHFFNLLCFALQLSRLSVFDMEGPIHLFANFVSKTVGGVAGVFFQQWWQYQLLSKANPLTGADWQETAEWKARLARVTKYCKKQGFHNLSP